MPMIYSFYEELIDMFKKLISKLYHKFVCKPDFDPHMTEEEHLGICKEEYMLSKFYDIDTYERISAINKLARVNIKMRKHNRT